MEKTAGQLAQEAFKSGLNCCESIIKMSRDLQLIDLPESTIGMGKFFQEGVGETGCICGALAGGVMILGMVLPEYKKGVTVVEQFKKQFIEENGSSCCRVIRKKQNIVEKFGSRKCRQITANTAMLLAKVINQNEQ